MRERYCYWSVADGHYAAMMERLIASARGVGVFRDFHVWSDRRVDGARNHRLGRLDKRMFMFKVRLLREVVSRLDYDYFVWLDADSLFVRHPGDPLRPLQGAPAHVPLESDATAARRPGRYYGCPYDEYVKFMHRRGVRSRSIFTGNGGYFVVKKEAVETFTELAADFWVRCQRQGFRAFREEPALAYAAQMLCGNPYLHQMERHTDLWMPDRVGIFKNRLPASTAWTHRDAITGASYRAKPALVHAPLSQGRLARPLPSSSARGSLKRKK